jgi:hypothetical protein
MASDRNHLRALVDALSDREVPIAILFLSELADEEVIDAETAAKLDQSLAEPGDDIPIEEVRRRLSEGSRS